jgi:hypothetical protein
MNSENTQQGSVLLVVLVSVFGFLTIVFGGLAVWSYMEYQKASTDVEGQVSLAVEKAKNEQRDEDETRFAEREKEPNREFVGPADYGRLTFKFPKTWSLYEETDITRGDTYKAYLNPDKVPPVSPTQQFAVRVLIENKDYERVVDQYNGLINKGDLRSSSTTSQGNIGVRLDGNFSKDIRGSAVVYKMRDKTITLRTDADTFKPDFEKVIQTISFDQ